MTMANDASPVFQSAAEEVAACLAPFIVAAQTNRLLPKQTWSDPFIYGFVMSYCMAAVRIMTGRAPTADEVIHVLTRVYRDTLRGDLHDAVGKSRQPQFADAAKSGGMHASAAQRAFAGESAVLDLPFVQDRLESQYQPAAVNLIRPTRLHPLNEHTWTGSRVMRALFSSRLMELDAR